MAAEYVCEHGVDIFEECIHCEAEDLAKELKSYWDNTASVKKTRDK